MPREVFVAGQILTAAEMNSVSDQTVMTFAGTAARGSAIPSPTEGMTSYLDDLNRIEVYNGSSWGPVGTILQVVSAVKTDTFTTSSTSFTDVTGLTATITPTSNTSKIFVSAFVNVAGSGGRFPKLQLVRDSTAIAIGDAAGSRVRSTWASYDGGSSQGSLYYGLIAATAQFLDSPTTTSSITYKVQMSTSTGTVYVNRSGVDSDNADTGRTVSTITLMEVAG